MILVRENRKIKIAIQGIKNSFHYIATSKYFKDLEFDVLECVSFEDLCISLKNGMVDYAVMAIENTIAGAILTNYNLLNFYNLKVVGEEYLRINLNLIGLAGQSIEDITLIQSHPKAIDQAGIFLRKYPNIRIETEFDTAAIVKKIKAGNIKGLAAIAPRESAEEYNLEIISENIEDYPLNYTRFLILSTKENVLSDDCNKGSMSFRVPNEHGALLKILRVFEKNSINLTKLQSIPMIGVPYEYLFYVDAIWSSKDDYLNLVKELEVKTLEFKIFGVYKEAGKIFEKKEVKVVEERNERKTDNTDVWLETLRNENNKHIIITGPCSAETEEQTISTIKEISNLRLAKVIRAGVWKPRTRAGGFEGMGIDALKWLQEAKKQTNLQIAVEVANAEHIELALKYGVDIIWIGARTSANPFSVQEIADAIRGIDIAVMIKNPISPDLDLWMGAIERISKANINKIIAIHRGFSVAEKTEYRNYPAWSIPIELRKRMPNIPIITDPSHIAGDRLLLEKVMQKAINIGTEGFIIETHINPQNAITDAKQQITPAELQQIFGRIKWDKKQQNELENMRDNIDSIDRKLINLLAERLDIAKEVGKFKKVNKMDTLQENRLKEIENNLINISQDTKLSSNFVKEIIHIIHEESIRLQKLEQ